jgi:hypothetical protein
MPKHPKPSSRTTRSIAIAIEPSGANRKERLAGLSEVAVAIQKNLDCHVALRAPRNDDQ